MSESVSPDLSQSISGISRLVVSVNQILMSLELAIGDRVSQDKRISGEDRNPTSMGELEKEE